MLSLGPSPTILPVSVDIRVQQLPGVVLHMLLDTGSTNSSLFLDAIDILGTQVTLKLWPVVPTEQIEPLFTLPISASGKVVTKYGTSVRPYVRLDVSLVNHNAQIPSKKLQVSLQTGRSFGKYNGILGLDYMAGVPDLVLDLVAPCTSESDFKIQSRV
ncbi:hypothetical protein GL50803_002830 [Giardia duodenalis]|uniref:Uncharacterized protein n=2 Tax=Giardia intestinalis TaxID=5741 RepID=A8BNX1_GIAIC|nr:hypothetical protein GL50803_002830 [Giardia intestinalis]ESU35087.1 Hypothetical protein DHA2_153948 [Giardia intestinalis]KAE8304665.1 hypothetical protein GL50803_002830 [Giardia intestinalis]|eukprot:XP_001705815.1 Hypothetical protein GL50803_2830 [Giardia lamblia ATCC 50803]